MYLCVRTCYFRYILSYSVAQVNAPCKSSSVDLRVTYSDSCQVFNVENMRVSYDPVNPMSSPLLHIKMFRNTKTAIFKMAAILTIMYIFTAPVDFSHRMYMHTKIMSISVMHCKRITDSNQGYVAKDSHLPPLLQKLQ